MWDVPRVGINPWKSKEKAAQLVCIEREKQQKRLSGRNMPLDMALFRPTSKPHQGALQGGSAGYSEFWFQREANS
jgi:hypothetical protein